MPTVNMAIRSIFHVYYAISKSAKLKYLHTKAIVVKNVHTFVSTMVIQHIPDWYSFCATHYIIVQSHFCLEVCIIVCILNKLPVATIA